MLFPSATLFGPDAVRPIPSCAKTSCGHNIASTTPNRILVEQNRIGNRAQMMPDRGERSMTKQHFSPEREGAVIARMAGPSGRHLADIFTGMKKGKAGHEENRARLS